jgi:hypothetical protein
MSGHTEKQTSESFEKTGNKNVPFTWTAASKMLPLVQHIVQEVLERRQKLSRLYPELDVLDRRRRGLAWPERSRRYQVQEEIAAEERHLQSARSELESLGAVLLDASGLVGFPTIVNNRPAYFSWKPGEVGLLYWQHEEEGPRRSIPAAWIKSDRRRVPEGRS